MRCRRAVSGLLIEHGMVLLVARETNEASQRIWAPPGGKVEAGESQREALVREMYEEVGLQVIVLQALGYLEVEDARSTYLITDYLVKRSSLAREDLVVPGDDAVEAAWFSARELMGVQLAPGVRQFFERVGVMSKLQ